jgi:mannosyltransferase OCH1-like enzyme
MDNIFINSYYKIIILFLVLTLLILKIQYDKYSYQPKFYDVPFLIEHTDTNSPRVISDLPLNIYMTWGSNSVPEKMKENIYNVCKMNPEFDVYIYSNEACIDYIKNNFDKNVLEAYNSLKPGAYKADLWRYCVLYKNGGVYMDIKLCTVEPLVNIIKDNPVIFVKDYNHPLHYILNTPPSNGIYNAFMVSPPNNIIFKKCIDDIINSCKLKLYKKNPLDITGPTLLGEVYINEYSIYTFNKLKFEVTSKVYPVFHFMTNDRYIVYNNRIIIKPYKEYRKEQRNFQRTKHYSVMWSEKDVYN